VKIITPAIGVAGLASLAMAAFVVHLALGFTVLGLALLVLEWRIDRGERSSNHP
jgi:cytochrome b561